MIKKLLVATALTALLWSCGGGGGGGSSTPTPTPVPRTAPLKYGYFGIDGDQIRETADHVSFVMIPDWGDWGIQNYDEFRTMQAITQLQEAKARGIKEAWLMVGWLVGKQSKGCISGTCVSIRPDAMQRLANFHTQLVALGLDQMVTTLYPFDEPETYGVSDATLTDLIAQIKTVWPLKVAVIYGGDNHGYPGLAAYDYVGKDHYGAGAGVLDELPPIIGGQRYILVPGGASCLNNNGPDDPEPFYNYAMTHNTVDFIMPFVWFDRGNCKGIRSNGMAPKYVAVAKKLNP